MKSPADLAGSLLRQWRDGARREERLVEPERAFPIELQIGAPPSRALRTEPAVVGAHLAAWREVAVGEVMWDWRSVRGLAEPVKIQVRWSIRSADEWMAAVDAHAPAGEAVSKMHAELAALSQILASVPPRFHRYLVRQLSLVMATGTAEAIRVAEVAASLEPGQADGLPLRALPTVGADTKFFERNERLLTALLDVRFDDQVSAVGLDRFLDAAPPSGQWLLVVDLDGDLLPYHELRLSDHTIAAEGLPGDRLLVVENERCRHAIPPISGCIAVLGAGRNLGWLSSQALASHSVIYWGDLDTWGLCILASARQHRPDLQPVLMDRCTFESHRALAVVEPQPAVRPKAGLNADENRLFDLLAGSAEGRLEQERLPVAWVRDRLDRLSNEALPRRATGVRQGDDPVAPEVPSAPTDELPAHLA